MLAPFVADAAGLRTIFAGLLPIEEVLPFGSEGTAPYDLTDHVVFEWAGRDDYLGEHPGQAGLRGAMNTSTDAAIRYRTPDGDIEVALIEWKYVEQYRGNKLSGGTERTSTRRLLYRPLWDDPDGPLRHDLVPYEDLFFEPFYQLMRQQFLAWRMEQAHELGADKVRVVIVAPSANRELARSFNTAGQQTLGYGVTFNPERLTVHTVWKAMQRRPDRFMYLDSATLVRDDSPLSDEFKLRYGHVALGELRPSHDSSAAPQVPTVTPVERLRPALERGLMILRRVSAEGGVLQQLSDMSEESLSQADAVLLNEAAARLDEVGELARRLRAEEVAHLLNAEEPGQ